MDVPLRVRVELHLPFLIDNRELETGRQHGLDHGSHRNGQRRDRQRRDAGRSGEHHLRLPGDPGPVRLQHAAVGAGAVDSPQAALRQRLLEVITLHDQDLPQARGDPRGLHALEAVGIHQREPLEVVVAVGHVRKIDLPGPRPRDRPARIREPVDPGARIPDRPRRDTTLVAKPVRHRAHLVGGTPNLRLELAADVAGKVGELGRHIRREPRVCGNAHEEDCGHRQPEEAGGAEADHVTARDALLRPHQGALQERPAHQRRHHQGHAAQHQHRRDGP